MENFNIETKPKEEEKKTPEDDMWDIAFKDPHFKQLAKAVEERIAQETEANREKAAWEEKEKMEKEEQQEEKAA